MPSDRLEETHLRCPTCRGHAEILDDRAPAMGVVRGKWEHRLDDLTPLEVKIVAESPAGRDVLGARVGAEGRLRTALEEATAHKQRLAREIEEHYAPGWTKDRQVLQAALVALDDVTTTAEGIECAGTVESASRRARDLLVRIRVARERARGALND